MEFLGIETDSVLWREIERASDWYWEYLQGDNIATDLITAHLQGGRQGGSRHQGFHVCQPIMRITSQLPASQSLVQEISGKN